MKNPSRAVFVLIVNLAVFNFCLAAAKASSNPSGTYNINSNTSRIDILVYKKGLLSTFGHNHVITSGILNGSLVMTPGKLYDSRFEIKFPVNRLLVDSPKARARYPRLFSKPITQSARTGTRRNMLTKIFKGFNNQLIRIESVEIGGRLPALELVCRVTINSVTRKITVRASAKVNNDSIKITGKTEINLTYFNIKPLKAALGTIQIKNKLDIYFSLQLQKP